MKALGRFGDFTNDWREIRAPNYADKIVLLAKEETVLQNMIERAVEFENNCGIKNKWLKNLG